jgi:MFS family permease
VLRGSESFAIDAMLRDARERMQREGPNVRRIRSLLAVMMAVVLSGLSGCAAMRDNPTLCTAVFTATGAAILGAAGGAIASEEGPDDDERNGVIAASTGGGVVAGGLIGWGLSHAFCEEPEPPPPPPVRAPPPPPPPPPPTERRGG